MKLVLEKADSFQKSINAISALIDEAEFVVNENGFALKAADPSQISMVDYYMKREAFKEFDVKEKTKIGVDLDYLRQVMSRATAGNQLTLETIKDNTVLSILFEGESKRKFEMPLLELSIAELPSPKIEETSTIKVHASILQEGLKDAFLINASIYIGVEENKFVLKAKGSKGDFNSSTGKDGKGLVELTATENGFSMFPIDYLQDMLRGTQSSTLVKLRMKKDSPIELSYNIGQAEIKYFLAPRIDG